MAVYAMVQTNMNSSDKKFTLQQILAAHAKVKSGADFPGYINEIKQLGVLTYTHYVTDGHVRYLGENGFSLSADPKWNKREVTLESNIHQLVADLKAHQAGNSDYLTFCKQAVSIGVEKWIVDLVEMTCIYYDVTGKQLLLEKIPTK